MITLMREEKGRVYPTLSYPMGGFVWESSEKRWSLLYSYMSYKEYYAKNFTKGNTSRWMQ